MKNKTWLLLLIVVAMTTISCKKDITAPPLKMGLTANEWASLKTEYPGLTIPATSKRTFLNKAEAKIFIDSLVQDANIISVQSTVVINNTMYKADVKDMPSGWYTVSVPLNALTDIQITFYYNAPTNAEGDNGSVSNVTATLAGPTVFSEKWTTSQSTYNSGTYGTPGPATQAGINAWGWYSGTVLGNLSVGDGGFGYSVNKGVGWILNPEGNGVMSVEITNKAKSTFTNAGTE